MANKYRSVLASGVQPTGNATVGDVLAGKTFSNADGVGKVGTMVNNGAVSGTATPSQPYTIPAGYHNGNGVVTAAGLPSSLIDKTMQFSARGTDVTDTIINVSNVNSMKVWSYNTAQSYGGAVHNPSGTVLASVSNTLAEGNAITIDVSALDYIYVTCSTANSTFTLAYKFLS